jgi:hypothetical protein
MRTWETIFKDNFEKDKHRKQRELGIIHKGGKIDYKKIIL